MANYIGCKMSFFKYLRLAINVNINLRAKWQYYDYMMHGHVFAES
ncbi:MAG: hypothetical protein WAN65_00600 [Candidatus Sulfotelmatobacter sp.]